MRALDPDVREIFADALTRRLPPAGGESRRPGANVLWNDLAESGVLGLGLTEQAGGVGGAQTDIGLVMQTLGASLTDAPFLSSFLCGFLIERAAGSAAKEHISGIVAGSIKLALAHREPSGGFAGTVSSRLSRAGRHHSISGTKTFVLDAEHADAFLVSVRDERTRVRLGIVKRDAIGVAVHMRTAVDGRSTATLEMRDAAVDLLSEERDMSALLQEAIDRAAVAVCAEALGAMEEVAKQTREYLKTRKAFGKTLSQFQVLQHRFVDILIALEETRAVVAAAEHACEQDQGTRTDAVRTCKVTACRAARFIGAQGVQLHGGIGMTDGLIISHFYKRLMMLEALYGNADYHLRMLAEDRARSMSAVFRREPEAARA